VNQICPTCLARVCGQHGCPSTPMPAPEVLRHGDPLFSHLVGDCHRCGCRVRCPREAAWWLEAACRTDGRWACLCPDCADWACRSYVTLRPELK